MDDKLRDEIKEILATGPIRELIKEEIGRVRNELAEKPKDHAPSDEEAPDPTPVSSSVDANCETLRGLLADSTDLQFRTFTTGYRGRRKGVLVYFKGLAKGEGVEEILEAALRYGNPPFSHPDVYSDPVLDFQETVAVVIDSKASKSLDEAVEAILAGETALFLQGARHVLLANTRWHPGRSVQEPSVESEVRGPRDGFVENIQVNMTLIRRRITDPRLRIEALRIGERSKTGVALVYIEELADSSLVDEARRRLEAINTDSALGVGYLEELIKDTPWSPFSILEATERPDKFTGNLLEGRVGVLQDNTPFGLIIPTTFWQLLQAPGDYYSNFWVASFFRWVRFGAFLVALTLPALYVILTAYHHEMIPTPLALSIAGGREGTPLPTILEVFLMLTMFEAIQEAGLRLPRAVGQTVSIVGALVIGEAAVLAGLIAPSTVIVIATAGITGFAMPTYALSLTVRLVRFVILLFSGVLGVFGFLGGLLALFLHLASLRSFGAPFLAPMVPVMVPEQRDTLVRAPWWLMLRRPRLGSEPRTVRQQPPAPKSSRHSDDPSGDAP